MGTVAQCNSTQSDPIARMLIQDITDMLEKTQEAIRLLDLKITEDLAAVKGLLSAHNPLDFNQLLRDSAGLKALQQQIASFEQALEQFLTLLEELPLFESQKNGIEKLLEECSDIKKRNQDSLDEIHHSLKEEESTTEGTEKRLSFSFQQS